MIDWDRRIRLVCAAVTLTTIVLALFATLANPAPQAEAQESWSTYLGGSQNDRATSVFVLSDGRTVVCGSTSSPDFPTTPGSFQPSYGGGASDGFITVYEAPKKP